MTFEELGLDPKLLALLEAEGLTEPTPVQEQAIPPSLEGKDVTALAQTGTGKTLAFVLPAFTRLAQKKPRSNMMLVLVPTRELARQVESVVATYGKPFKLRSACLYGGVGYGKQNDDLKRGSSVVVATPGRLLDHMQRGNVRFNDLEILVIDEADRMLDMGFLPDVRRILEKLPQERQTLFATATFPRAIHRLAEDMQKDPVRIEAGQLEKPVETVRQQLYTVQPHQKMTLLRKILHEQHIESALIFLRTKMRTERVTKSLHKAGYKAQAIHGDRNQKQREQALEAFRSGRVPILVATDVAARGLDISGITHVINYDIPENPDDYLHRIGRTARASAEGDAITFVTPNDHTALEAIERVLGHRLPREEWEGAVPVLSLYSGPEEAEAMKKKARKRTRARGLLRRR
jgi:ATP-dependent RNA helicase RhlE